MYRLNGRQETEWVGDEACPAGQLLPSLPEETTPLTNSLAANVILLQPQTGEVLALVGAPPTGLETTPLPEHPPGTLVTPWIYLTAFTRGFSPASLLWDLLPDQEPASEGTLPQGPIALANCPGE